MPILKEIEQNIKEMRRRSELDGESWIPSNQVIRVTQAQWDSVLVDPYLSEAFPIDEDRNTFITAKKLFGVQIIIL